MIGFTASREELAKEAPDELEPSEDSSQRELSCTGITTQINTSRPQHGWRRGDVRPVVAGGSDD